MHAKPSRRDPLPTACLVLAAAASFVARRATLVTLFAFIVSAAIYAPAEAIVRISSRIAIATLAIAAVSSLLDRRLSRGHELDREWR